VSSHYEVFVPLDGHEWITANQRLFWRIRSERTKMWRRSTAWHARAAKLPYIPAALIVCELRFATKHRRDPANWAPTAKACVDGLVDAGVFDDDDHKHITGPDMRIGAVVAPFLRGVALHIFARREL
jgi:crossover junction endodeoxyribonuclease RusA